MIASGKVTSPTRLTADQLPSGGGVSPHAITHTDGTDDIQNATASQKGLATSTQIAKLDGIAGDADNTATALAPTIHAATSKGIPVDADEFALWDSVASALKKLTWANLKATFVTYFNSIFGTTYIKTGTSAALPASGDFVGQVYIESDSYKRALRWTGSAWYEIARFYGQDLVSDGNGVTFLSLNVRTLQNHDLNQPTIVLGEVDSVVSWLKVSASDDPVNPVKLEVDTGGGEADLDLRSNGSGKQVLANGIPVLGASRCVYTGKFNGVDGDIPTLVSGSEVNLTGETLSLNRDTSGVFNLLFSGALAASTNKIKVMASASGNGVASGYAPSTTQIDIHTWVMGNSPYLSDFEWEGDEFTVLIFVDNP